jgi:hypothetical protein
MESASYVSAFMKEVKRLLEEKGWIHHGWLRLLRACGNIIEDRKVAVTLKRFISVICEPPRLV